MRIIWIIILLLTSLFLILPKSVNASCDFGNSFLKTNPGLNTIVAEAESEELHCESYSKDYKYKTLFVIKGKNIGNFSLIDSVGSNVCPKIIEDDPSKITVPPPRYAGSPELPYFEKGKKYLLVIFSDKNGYANLPMCYIGITSSQIFGYLDPKILFFIFQAYFYPVQQLTMLIVILISGLFYSTTQSGSISLGLGIVITALIYILVIVFLVKIVRKLIKLILAKLKKTNKSKT